ncbi:hypothetical protein [Actinomadura rayongensis]|uniref:Uncharacterized protein n=1 Tax=Actinomadura rayongensis TaxID=1429076 RepID=A0A6I4W195_9ACTN|nr:hypothetical protein [Actinomadura rayongensis]MXQ63263.1 hypothetical protein [Actinomadura rayongensis]
MRPPRRRAVRTSRLGCCALHGASSAVAVRRRTARSALCWQRPTDHERRRRSGASYPRVGRA